MSFETLICWVCAIYVVGYFLIREVNWKVVKKWISL